MFKINPVLEMAIERNKKWIEKKCKLSERNTSKCEDLIGDVTFNLYASDKNFSAKENVNSDAWVKKIAINVTAKYKNQQMIEKSIISENVDNIEASQNSNIEHRIDAEITINYIKSNLSERDREIMFLYLMGEPHSVIAELIGLEVVTINNIVSARKKEINEYLNKGLI